MGRQLARYQGVRAVTCVVIGGIHSRSMLLDTLAQYGWPGAALAVAAGLVYTLIKRGFRFTLRAEVPKRRSE